MLCAEIPPYCYYNHNKPTGVIYDIGMALNQRMHTAYSIKITPLARTLAILQNRPRIISLWTGRIPERENKMQWVAPIFHDAFSIYTVKGRAPAYTLEQAKNLPLLGANIAGANTLAARANGLENLKTNPSDETNGKMLLADRIQGWITAEGSVRHFLRQQGLPADTLVKGVELSPYDAYLAASNDWSAAELAKWAQALREMQKDGSYMAILQRYNLSQDAARMR